MYYEFQAVTTQPLLGTKFYIGKATYCNIMLLISTDCLWKKILEKGKFQLSKDTYVFTGMPNLISMELVGIK